MSRSILVHESPVWREKADFIIAARIHSARGESKLEQLWARQLDVNRFEICCIPFFVYDLALGDQVKTSLEQEDRYVIERVTKRSGRYTFRVWFNSPAARQALPEIIIRMGCLVEWQTKGGHLLAIDAESEALARQVAGVLQQEEDLGHLVFETGRTKA